MNTDNDFADLLGEDPTPAPPAKPNNGHGGKRARAGGKSKAVRDATEEHHIKYTKSRAEHEEFKARSVKLEYEIKRGKYVLREEVQRASAVAFATVTQNLRSIPDALERRLGLSPEVTEQVAIAIDEIMSDLADDLEKMHTSSAPEIVATENDEPDEE